MTEAKKNTATTGDKCPQGGVWHPKGKPSDTRAIGVGNTMPTTTAGDTEWVLKTPTGDK